MPRKRLKSIINILARAGEAILKIYESDDFQMELKMDKSPVTLADIKSGKIIDEGLNQLFPKTPIINEENNLVDHEERKKWTSYFLVDPLDGTKEFIKRNGEFCINLALMEKNIPMEGWIYQPLEKKGWYCKRGSGIFSFDDKGNIKVFENKKKTDSFIRIVASRSFFKPLEEKMITEIGKLFPIEIVHRGSSLKQIDIIRGKADMYLKAGPCSEWDTAPGQLMVEEFGGAVLRQSDFKPMEYNKPDVLNPHFVMLNSSLSTSEFIEKLMDIVKRLRASRD